MLSRQFDTAHPSVHMHTQTIFAVIIYQLSAIVIFSEKKKISGEREQPPSVCDCRSARENKDTICH